MKKILTLLLVFLCACSGAPDDKDTIVFAHRSEMESLDPVYPYDGVSHGLIMNVYDTLIKFDGAAADKFAPSLADMPQISDDGLEYKFKIRRGVKFHNGYDFTPEDARYSLLRFMLSDRAGGPASLLLEPVLGISSTRTADGFDKRAEDAFDAVRVDGDYLIIRLKKPFAPFLAIMTRWSYIVSQKWCVQNGEWDGSAETWKQFNNRDKSESYLFNNMNGTGPFRLARWDIAGKKLMLTANENYFTGAPKIKNVFLISVDETSTMRLMLESGEADIAEISQKFSPQMREREDIVLLDNLPRLKVDPVIFFTADINAEANADIGSGKLDGEGIPPDFFNDINVRKAFAHSFDYEAFLNDTHDGKGALANGPVPPGIAGYRADAPYYNFDLKKAEAYFKKARGGAVWENGFKFTLSYNTSGDMRQIACEIIKRNVESLNPKFKIELRSVTWPMFLEKAEQRKMPMWARGWVADYADAHNFAFAFLHGDGRYAQAQGFKNARLDALIEAALAETDAETRAELYARVQKIAYEETRQIFTVYPGGVLAHGSDVKGFYDNPVFMGVYFYPLYK